MAAAKKSKKAKPPRPWSKAEDHYLASFVGSLPDGQIAEDLGRTTDEVAGRVAATNLGGIRAQRERAKRTGAFDNPAPGVYTMTAVQATRDDAGPKGPDLSKLPSRTRGDVSTIW